MPPSKLQVDHSGKSDSQEIASRIRTARARAGLTRKLLAQASGASERYLAHLEAGTGNPSIEMLLVIANALGIAAADLLPQGGEKDPMVAEAASLLRRMPAEQLANALASLGNHLGLGEGKWQRISLIGLRGAGKTSLGSALAKRLSVPFVDISKEVELRYGGSIGVLIEMNGPAALHRIEAEVLTKICKEHTKVVIAAPGAVVANENLYAQLLRSTWSIWLQASPNDHMERVIAQGDLRPMAGNRSAMKDLEAILAARSAEYGLADAAIDTSAQDFDHTLALLEEVAMRLRG